MKKTLGLLALTLLFTACGSTNKNQKETISEEKVADEIIQEIDRQKGELMDKRNETLTEVDSLLENL